MLRWLGKVFEDFIVPTLLLFMGFGGSAFLAVVLFSMMKAPQADQLPEPDGQWPPTGCYAYCDTRTAACMTNCATPTVVPDCMIACAGANVMCRQACDEEAQHRKGKLFENIH